MKRLGSVLGGLVPGFLLAVSFFWITSQLSTAQGGSVQGPPAGQRRELGAVINGTIITGPIEFDTTWTVGGSPYVIVGDDWGRLIVNAGATLAVEPGVIVKVSAGGTIYIHGQLEARGTITEPITFTSLQDDSVGGDTNGDGDATTPAPGDWYYVVAVGSGQAWVEQAEVRYAGQRDYYGQGYGALFANSAECGLFITSTVITASNSSGVYLWYGTASVISTTVENANGDGIHEREAAAVLRGNNLVNNQSHGIGLEARPGDRPVTTALNAISDNLGDGIHVLASGVRFEGQVYSNTIENNARFPAYMEYDQYVGGGGLVEMRRNSFSGNGWGDPGYGNALALQGTLIFSETLGREDGPVYIIWNLHVKDPAHLTVEPGTILKFVGTEAALGVTGQLEARGTAADPIYFTSIYDDEAGGDTNGDGGATQPGPGQWRFVQVSGAGQAVLERAVLRYGGYPIPWNPLYGIVYLASANASVVISDSVVSDSAAHGLYLEQGQTSVYSTTVRDCQYNGLAEAHAGGSVAHSTFVQNGAGIAFDARPGDPPLAVTDNLVASNGENGVSIGMANGPVTPTLTGNRIEDNGGAAVVLTYDGGAGLPDVSGTTFSGNAVNGLRLAGSLGFNMTLPADLGVVYNPTDLSVPAGVELCLEPGVIAKVGGNIGVLGRLVAVGEAGSPVVFTSIADDSWGGDTNSDGGASQPAPGQWGFIQVYGAGSAVLDHALLHYGGYYYPWNPPYGQVLLGSPDATVELRDCEALYSETNGLYLSQGQATIERCEVSHSQFTGVGILNGATVDIVESYVTHNNIGIAASTSEVAVASSNIYSNTELGVQNDPASPVLHAEDNWWGHPSGPFQADSNPFGLGDAVSENVAYAPWLAGPGARYAALLNLGEPAAGLAVSQRFTDYQLQVQAGMALVARVTPPGSGGSLWLFSREGDLPNWTQYDQQTRQKSLSGLYELPIVAGQDGTLYLSVYGYSVAGGSDDFQIVVDQVGRELVDVWPRQAGNAGQATLWLSGLPFGGEMGMELHQGGVTLTPMTVTVVTSSSLWAVFDLQGAPMGVYDVAAVWPDQGEATLPGAVTVVEGAGAQIEAELLLPDFVRPGRTYVMWVEYANTGDADMAAPLLAISNTQGVAMRLEAHTEFSTGTVQIMGSSPVGDAGTLPLGGSGQVPVYFQAPADIPGHTVLNFLCIMYPPLGEPLHPIDWGALEPEVRPADADPELWSAFWPALTSRFGNTLESYRYRLNANAMYLGGLGRRTSDTRTLFQFEARKLLGITPRPVLAGSADAQADGPGMALEFARVFPGSTEARFYQGPLGYGWSHAYDIYVQGLSNGDVVIHWPGALTRQFSRTDSGAYRPAPGDSGRLWWAGDHFVLTEKDGTVYSFRSDNRLEEIEDTNGNRVWAVYDGAGRLVEVHHSGGAGLSLTYNGQGRIASLTDQAGRTTSYGYDGSGQHLVSVTAPGGRVTAYAYSASTGQLGDHALTTITAPDGRQVSYGYDSVGRLKEEALDGSLQRIRYSYSFAGQFYIKDDNNKVTTIYPDENGRPTMVKDPLGNRFTQQFDGSNHLTAWKDAAGRSYGYSYDVWGNTLSAVNPLGGVTYMGYEPQFSRLSYVEDPRRNRTDFEYDPKGNLAAAIYPDNSQEGFGYDPEGNVTAFTRRSGEEIAYSYDAAGRLTGKDYPDGWWAAYGYDAAGNLTSASDPNGTITLTYDPQTDRLTQISYPSGRSFSFAYDDAGRRTQRVGDDGYTVNYEYDAAGRLYRLTDGGGAELVEYSYGVAGRLSGEEHGNGTYTTYAYDAAGRLTSVVNYGPGGGVQSRFDYSYDANGNRTSMTTVDGTTTYSYDATNQLTGAAYPDGRQVSYAYDGAGNRQWVNENGVVEHYTANNLNQYSQAGGVTLSYDANGNLATRSDGSGTTTYQYDYENRLVQVTAPGGESWEYTYNALGQRTAVVHNGVVTEYVYDPIGWEEVAAEYGPGGALEARYVQGLGLAARIDGGGNAAFYGFDGVGNTRQMSDSAGAVANRYDYDPFGVAVVVSETVANRFRFGGQVGVVDEGNGLLFMRNRDYIPGLARFTSPDPIGYLAGVGLYRYAGNNPVRWTDPVGFYEIPTYGEILQDFTVAVGLKQIFGKYPNYDEVRRAWRSGWTSGTFINEYLRARNWPERFHAIGVYGLKNLLEYLKMIAPPHIRPFIFPGVLVGLWDRWTYDFGMWLFTPRNLKSPKPFATVPIGGGGTEVITSGDPNEKQGPAGVGEQHAVRIDQELTYAIYFENVVTATAPAQEVVVVDYLDPSLDWTALRLAEIAWGEESLVPPGGSPDYAVLWPVEDYRAEVTKTWWVEVRAALNPVSGRLEWTLRTLDPETGQLPEDPLAGLLPPNDESGRGEGRLAFTIRPRPDTPPGTIITNQATIVFDVNPPIVTNAVTNRVGVLGRVYLPLVVKGGP